MIDSSRATAVDELFCSMFFLSVSRILPVSLVSKAVRTSNMTRSSSIAEGPRDGSKVADFDPPHLHSAPPWGVTPVEFRGDLWRQKTSVTGLSCGVACLILSLAVLVEHRLVTDRRTRPMASTADALRGNKIIVK